MVDASKAIGLVMTCILLVACIEKLPEHSFRLGHWGVQYDGMVLFSYDHQKLSSGQSKGAQSISHDFYIMW
jgi:hypothetical protein